MNLKILKYKKNGKDKYKLYLDNNEEIEVYEDVIIKNDLLLKKEININEMDEINKQNKVEYGYIISLKYISIKMRSEKEIRDYLIKKNMELGFIDIIVERLKKNNLINDEIFCRAFINDQVNITNNGINRIIKGLQKYGIKQDIIDNEISKIDSSIIKEKLSRLINKQLKVKKGSCNQIKQKLLLYFINLGYDKDMIISELSKFDIKTDLSVLKKDYQKLYATYSKKYNESELKYIIYNKLLIKGYSSEDIKSVLK